MVDMRATERLLEFIAEQTNDPKITAAIDELRRRGDTLVRSRDLQAVIEAITREQITLGEDDAQALARLDGSLGGVL